MGFLKLLNLPFISYIICIFKVVTFNLYYNSPFIVFSHLNIKIIFAIGKNKYKQSNNINQYILILLKILNNRISMQAQIPQTQKQSLQKKLKEKNKSFNQKKIQQDIFLPKQLDIKLATNPFLNDQQKFQFLIHKLKEYNKCLENGQVTDSYQQMVYERLYSLLNTVANLLTRDLQVDRLGQVCQWFVKEEKLIAQRRNQGHIRYMVTKQYMQQTNGIQPSPQFIKDREYTKIDQADLIPSELVAYKNLPFLKKWRTTHKQLETPEQRLKEYRNRKSLNFGVLKYSSQKQAKKGPKITYPRIVKLKYEKQYEVQQGAQNQPNKDQTNPNPQNPQAQPQTEGQKKQGELQANPDIQPEQQQGQDLGFGQEPNEQPQQQQQIQQQDKLAPRLKSYIFEPKGETKQEITSHKRMNDRYLKIQSDFTRKQNQDAQFVEIMHSWAAKKSQLDKQVIKRIQAMGLKYSNYNLSPEQPQKQQTFPEQDAKKYGLSKTFQVRTCRPDLDLTLPAIKNNSQMYEKSIRKDKLSVLKKKFGKMLNLQDYQQREISQSMCQVSQERKGFSQILRKHSKSKQRLRQLDQVMILKQKLARGKVSIDITALSASMCVPEDEQNLPQNSILDKSLLSNPFWVQPAKKKKKKK